MIYYIIPFVYNLGCQTLSLFSVVQEKKSLLSVCPLEKKISLLFHCFFLSLGALEMALPQVPLKEQIVSVFIPLGM